MIRAEGGSSSVTDWNMNTQISTEERLDEDTERVYMRDASVLSSPGRAGRFHIANSDMSAACNANILLNEDNWCLRSQAGILHCRRCSKLKGVSPLVYPLAL